MIPITGWITGDAIASMLNVGPDLALHCIGQTGQEHQEQDDAHAHLLALDRFRVGRPGQEGDDIMRLLLELLDVPSV